MNNKTALKQAWQNGDNVRIAQWMYDEYGIEITGQAVGQWIRGVNGSKIEPLLMKAAKAIQENRKRGARQEG